MGQGNCSTKQGKWKQLCEKERYQIEMLLKAKHGIRKIAALLGRDRRTIEREILRGTVIQWDTLWRDRHVCLADVGQRACANHIYGQTRT